MGDEKYPAHGLNNEKVALNIDESAASGDLSYGNDASTVKFVDGHKDKESEVLVNGKEKAPDDLVGLTKEDLKPFAEDPYWVRVRVVMLVLFAVTWVVMLVAAIMIIVFAPKCPYEPDLDWWQKAIVYHIHPQSFKDSNEDGFGDVKGIHEKVDYLKNNLHVGAVCIGPMYPTPNFDYGYDIKNYDMICPGHYGTADDLEDLIVTLRKKGIKLVLDFVPNHTSRRHPWFVESSTNKNASNIYRDFYVWHPGSKSAGGDRLPPNNWLSVYGGSAWTFHEERQEFYYHTFSEDEPDLNLRNEAVVLELDKSLKKWLKAGVAGFRLYGVQYLVESVNVTQNEPPANGVNTTELNDIQPENLNYESLLHTQTAFQPESYELVAHWRELLDDYSNNDGNAKSRYYPRLLIAEVKGTASQTAAFVKESDRVGAHIATNIGLTKLKQGCYGKCVYDLVTEWTRTATATAIWSNWQLGNVDVSRVATRFGDSHYTNAFSLLLLTLPGTPLVYYGDEIGMKDITIDPANCQNESIVNNHCRITQRSPMQWSDKRFAGFTTGNSSWLPVGADYHRVNVEAQLAHGSGISPINVFSEVAELRKEQSFLFGEFYPAVAGNVFFYVRQAEGFDGYLVAINFGPHPSTVDFVSASPEKGILPTEGDVKASTGNFAGHGRSDDFKVGAKVKLNSVYLENGEGIVVHWDVAALNE